MGAGTATSTPTGIDCWTDCIEIYLHDTVVTMTATPALSPLFLGFTGEMLIAPMGSVINDHRCLLHCHVQCPANSADIKLSRGESGRLWNNHHHVPIPYLIFCQHQSVADEVVIELVNKHLIQ